MKRVESTAILDRILPLPAAEIDAPVKPVETPTETPTFKLSTLDVPFVAPVGIL